MDVAMQDLTPKFAFPRMNNVLNALGLKAAPTPPHQHHFHVDFKTPDRVLITVPQHLQSTVVQTIDAGIDTDAELSELVEAACTEMGLQPGEFDMVTLDTAPVPLHTVALVAKADGQQLPSKERVMGVCSLVSYLAPGAVPRSGEGGSAPNDWAREYFRQYEKRELAYPTRADVTVVEQPKHGKVVLGTNSANLELMQYIPEAGYVGSDRIVYSVSVEGKPVKLVYFVHVTKRNLDDALPTDFCKANTWKISLESPSNLPLTPARPTCSPGNAPAIYPPC